MREFWPLKGSYPIGCLEHRFPGPDSTPARLISVHFRYPVSAAKGGDAPRPRSVLLAMPGWDGSFGGIRSLTGALASRGFLVAEIGLAASGDDPRTMDFSTPAAGDATVALAADKVRWWSEAISTILDTLCHQSFIRDTGIRDSYAVGALGFSFGGAIAAQAAWRDTRIGAVVNLDGWLFGDVATNHFTQPYLMVNDDTPLPDEAALNAIEPARRYRARLTDRDARWQDAQLAHGGGYKLTMAGSRHDDFHDGLPRNPLRLRAASRARKAVRDYAHAFFEKVLDGTSTPLLEKAGQSQAFANARLDIFDHDMSPSVSNGDQPVHWASQPAFRKPPRSKLAIRGAR